MYTILAPILRSEIHQHVYFLAVTRSPICGRDGAGSMKWWVSGCPSMGRISKLCCWQKIYRSTAARRTEARRYIVPGYDTIRDAISTCARKPTWVSLIDRTGTTTKKCKTEKLKSNNGYVRSNSKLSGESRSQSWRRKEGYSGKDFKKSKVLSLEWRSDGWWNTNNNKYEMSAVWRA